MLVDLFLLFSKIGPTSADTSPHNCSTTLGPARVANTQSYYHGSCSNRRNSGGARRCHFLYIATVWPNPGRVRPKMGRRRSILPECWPDPPTPGATSSTATPGMTTFWTDVELGRLWAEFWPTSTSTNADQIWPGTQTRWPRIDASIDDDVSQTWSEFGRLRPEFGQLWPNFGQHRPNFTRHRQHLAQNRPALVRRRSHLARTRPISARKRPHSTYSGPDTANCGPKSTNSGPTSVKFRPPGEAERSISWNAH